MKPTPGIIIISAPSGTGKSSVIAQIIDDPALRLRFSISATNRLPRGVEEDGKHYFFLSDEQFRNAIDQDLFVEYVEVYPGRYYGTLKRELQRIHSEGYNLLLDIDVEGALKVKNKYPQDTLAIFLAPPSLDTLRERLLNRGTDSIEVIEERLRRASYEMEFAPKFDFQVTNDKLDECSEKVKAIIVQFLNSRT